MSRAGAITAWSQLEAQRPAGRPVSARSRRKRPFWKVLKPVLTALTARV